MQVVDEVEHKAAFLKKKITPTHHGVEQTSIGATGKVFAAAKAYEKLWEQDLGNGNYYQKFD